MGLVTGVVPAVLTLALAGCGQAPAPSLHGYIEGHALYLAAPQAGYLSALNAPRGSRVEAAQPVFTLDADPDNLALAEAQARVNAASQRTTNLQQPRRAPEVAALEASLRAAQAAQRLAQSQLTQQQALAAQHFVSPARLNEVQAALDQASAQAESARQQLASFRAAVGRQAEVGGAQADEQAAQALAAQRQWVVARKTVRAPQPGEVADTYYQPGEWVPAGAPVASLLPDASRRIRFFVPEPQLAQVHIGQAIRATCDGCAAPLLAHIDFISPSAEYTPPVLYSRGSREKLVFRVEAVPEGDTHLTPGLPVDVSLPTH
jgi:HlyD family secretion protein